MENAVSLVLSAFGAYFCGMDFCDLFMFISCGIALFKTLSKFTNDKSALQ